MSIEIQHLSKRYGDNTIITDLSLTFPSGRISVLLGPSGCGKTTTLRCVAGLEGPDAGMIRIDEKVVFSEREHQNLPPEQRNIGMVFQSYAIWPHMSVFENVALPLKARGVPRAQIKERVAPTLKAVGLEELASRSATQLSGGQQQRVALARCLASRPRAILLDEPLSNLDAKLRVEMRSELKELQLDTQATMLFVTHDQEEALSLADQIYLFEKGAVVQSGTPRELYFEPRTRFAAEFLGKANLFRIRLAQGAQGTEIRTLSGDICVAAGVAEPRQTGREWLAMIRPEAWRIAGESGAVPGTVEQASFNGGHSMLHVDTPLGRQFVSVDGHRRFENGERVSLDVACDRVHLIEVQA